MRVRILAIRPALRRRHAAITLRWGLSGAWCRMSNGPRTHQCLLLIPTRALQHRLVVKVHRGLVTSVHDIPDGMAVEVRDYDAPKDGPCGRKIEYDEDGRYLAEVYDGSAEAEKGELRDRKRRRRKN